MPTWCTSSYEMLGDCDVSLFFGKFVEIRHSSVKWYFGMFTAEGNVLMLFSTFHGDDYLRNKKKVTVTFISWLRHNFEKFLRYSGRIQDQVALLPWLWGEFIGTSCLYTFIGTFYCQHLLLMFEDAEVLIFFLIWHESMVDFRGPVKTMIKLCKHLMLLASWPVVGY